MWTSGTQKEVSANHIKVLKYPMFESAENNSEGESKSKKIFFSDIFSIKHVSIICSHVPSKQHIFLNFSHNSLISFFLFHFSFFFFFFQKKKKKKFKERPLNEFLLTRSLPHPNRVSTFLSSCLNQPQNVQRWPRHLIMILKLTWSHSLVILSMTKLNLKMQREIWLYC